ncbi:hypothetical protein JHW43_008947 [Diplocarpon mali]|nr:hypothetical protein JHW43_008947 [Diplocarpon mali]
MRRDPDAAFPGEVTLVSCLTVRDWDHGLLERRPVRLRQLRYGAQDQWVSQAIKVNLASYDPDIIKVNLASYDPDTRRQNARALAFVTIPVPVSGMPGSTSGKSVAIVSWTMLDAAAASQTVRQADRANYGCSNSSPGHRHQRLYVTLRSELWTIVIGCGQEGRVFQRPRGNKPTAERSERTASSHKIAGKPVSRREDTCNNTAAQRSEATTTSLATSLRRRFSEHGSRGCSIRRHPDSGIALSVDMAMTGVALVTTSTIAKQYRAD